MKITFAIPNKNNLANALSNFKKALDLQRTLLYNNIVIYADERTGITR